MRYVVWFMVQYGIELCMHVSVITYFGEFCNSVDVLITVIILACIHYILRMKNRDITLMPALSILYVYE